MTASRTWTAWSCTVRLTVDDPAVLGAACGELKALMDRVDKAASRFRPDSELSIVNSRAGAMVPVSRLLVDLVDVSLVAASMSGGAVDPTVGAAVIAAGYDDDIERGTTALPAAGRGPEADPRLAAGPAQPRSSRCSAYRRTLLSTSEPSPRRGPRTGLPWYSASATAVRSWSRSAGTCALPVSRPSRGSSRSPNAPATPECSSPWLTAA